MSATYVTLVNQLLRRLNEVALDTAGEGYRVLDEVNTTGAAPIVVYQTNEEKFGISPPPKTDYVVEYVYFAFPVDLDLYTDTTLIPARFNHTLIDGAMMYLMRFRSNDSQAQIHQANFEEGIKAMRRLLLDESLRVRSTVIERSNQPTSFSGVV